MDKYPAALHELHAPLLGHNAFTATDRNYRQAKIFEAQRAYIAAIWGNEKEGMAKTRKGNPITKVALVGSSMPAQEIRDRIVGEASAVTCFQRSIIAGQQRRSILSRPTRRSPGSSP